MGNKAIWALPLLWLSLGVQAAGDKGGTKVDKAEMSRITQGLGPMAEQMANELSFPDFASLQGPYAPMYLESNTTPVTDGERNFFFGFINGAYGLTRKQILTLNTAVISFSTSDSEKQRVSNQAAALTALFSDFDAQSASLIARWLPDQYRIDDVWFVRGQTSKRQCGQYRINLCDAYLPVDDQATPAQLALIHDMAKLRISALKKDEGAVRAIIASGGNNEMGVLQSRNAMAVASFEQHHDLALFLKIADGTFYYVSRANLDSAGKEI